ncbi:DUF262 domain-containing protein [Limosilactobacillus reuteri]|uniref:DUF262 domain-containing protein n=1 Tax=Limosilactobacillus reuteri TaxID=1598 RepID=A0A7L6BFJ4_LIMRT|nr:DUF262 domain-containing protein [Limosilactobacillus reuteri]MQB60918.1 DUF262 domain-containing protein [Limosilactobacillus reuteri]MQB65989.1 DUF262 domain-containing protein [Limosilactobacillus reuteri]MQB76626.1 DUF262 domain-containing protein [Limosilactobacillus reuteri]MQB98619.1 DUF262 domain-containing protein [Limosilactobacillus reuteri]QLQ60932.1 DUF262 domain-containing protein [Limosilactobacillus reuteri]
MKADSIHLFDFLGSSKTIFEIPVFQRNYEWDKDQCEQLFKDLTVAAQTNTDHFIGAIVYVTETGNKMSHIYRIIDGQQRLTSLTLLLKALSDADEQDRDEIEEEYLTNKYLDDNNHLKLKPVEHDYEAFDSVMNNMTDFDKPSKVIDNYKFFRKLIEDSDIGSDELYEAMNHFNMVYIELSGDSNEENPQVIFESLNSTGVSLSPSDLVRNFLLMKLDSQQQEELYKKYWVKIERMFATPTFAEFIRHYLVVKTHISVKKNSVYSGYKDYFVSNQLSSNDALADLFKFANYYDQILNHNSNDYEFNRIMEHINVMDSKVVYPYLMLLMDLVNSKQIDQKEANELAHILESYLFRIKVCKLATNRLNKVVVGLCDLSKEDGNLKLRLLRLLKSSFPDDRKLLDSLIEVDLYHQRNHMAKLSLIILEEHRTRETINFDDAQVEHIMPQRLNAEWRLQVANADKVKEQYGGILGNLTLTKYNQEMSNKPYSEKKEFYKDSNVSLTREVAETYDKWGKDAIIDRTEKLTRELIKIFPMPHIKEISEEEVTGEYTIDQTTDVTGKKPVQITISGNEHPVKTWRQMLVIFLNDIWNKDSLNFDRIKENRQLSRMLFRTGNTPEKLENGTMIETNFSATVILAIIAKISEICDITDQVSYAVK